MSRRSREECESWLREFLGEGSYFIWYVRSQAIDEGFSLSQLEWARMRLRLVTTRITGEYSWELPE